MVQIIESNITKYNNLGEVHTADVKSGNHHLVVVLYLRTGKVNVVNMNASHNAWNGLGKFFDSLDEAVNNYKTQAIKDCIRAILTVGESK